MTTLELLNKEASKEVRDTKVISQLYTKAVYLEGLKLDIKDYMGPTKSLDLSNEGKKDHCSSAA